MKLFASKKVQKFFSLMELVIVLAIAAIVAGGALASYDGMQATAAQGVASKDIATISSAIRNYTAIEKSAPNDFDSMLAATYDVSATALTGVDDAGVLPTKINGKLVQDALSSDQVDALNNAGITTARYLDAVGNNPADGTYTLAAPDAAGATGTTTVGSVTNIDIPNRAFDLARVGSNNRGRGFSRTLVTGDTVQTWDATKVENNQKLGAADDDILVAFGLGNNCSIVGADKAGLASAPTYGNVEKNEYSRYIVLYNVGPSASPFSKAKLQAVLDTRGDFLDEELAEYSGQKQ